MEYLEKMQVIERHAGSKTKAAELAGVTLNTWSRWANQRVNPTGTNGDTRSLRLIELLFEQVSTQTPPASEREA
jgi:hypothetical protein